MTKNKKCEGCAACRHLNPGKPYAKASLCDGTGIIVTEEIHNAKIVSTRIGEIPDVGIMTFDIQIMYPGYNQELSFGYHYNLSGLPLSSIGKLLAILGVAAWEDLPKKVIRVKVKPMSGMLKPEIQAVGHIIHDRWFTIDDLREREGEETHQDHHIRLHRNLDELVADYVNHVGDLPSKTTVMTLMEWAATEKENPTGEKT